ncbi:uncharacterized protein CCR75_003432 [Bremia lactucae]|uniref:Uncharacterized protein n=1 Tax=Bremia lactucae TaxID=4779 RepID=A0A976NXM9_BRELC|nr:hypothetical protein CCR75_003432 [Bremia lactucae]
MGDLIYLEHEQHIRMFVKLANLTQTSQLHDWNLESLQRALEWASAAEAVTCCDKTQQKIETSLRRWFPVATIPTLPVQGILTVDTLSDARIHLLRSILQSPYLASHPTRSELLIAVLQKLQSLREATPSPATDDVENDQSNRLHSRAIANQTDLIFALLTEAFLRAEQTVAFLAIIQRMSDKCNHIRVQALTADMLRAFSAFWVGLDSSKQELHALASHASTEGYGKDTTAKCRRCACCGKAREDLRSCFEAPESKDVRASLSLFLNSPQFNSLLSEVVLLMLVTCEWPKEEPLQLKGMVKDLLRIVSEWIATKPIRFWTFQPWLAAMLSSKAKALAQAYVDVLFTTGLSQPFEPEFVERIATLILQPGVEDVLKPALLKLDPYLQQVYFNINPFIAR